MRYPNAYENALDGVTLTLPSGASTALVGPSGAGKSTLADAILGVVGPTSGDVRIAGVPVHDLIARSPGSIAYVPQDVALVSGTVRENVALGTEPSDVEDDRVWEALEKAHLDLFFSESRDGLDTVIGERGVRLSGGQRQRLGIARALYSRPRLIVLDEATSALDAETESAVTTVVRSETRGMTTITVAHRLATVRHVDHLVYLDKGKIVARGTFEEVRKAVPQFDRQARLMGL